MNSFYDRISGYSPNAEEDGFGLGLENLRLQPHLNIGGFNSNQQNDRLFTVPQPSSSPASQFSQGNFDGFAAKEFGNFVYKSQSELDPSIGGEGVVNKELFVSSGNHFNDGNRNQQHDKVKRPKYMPLIKTPEDLFDETAHIAQGPQFEAMFGERNDYDITVTGGDGKCPVINSFEKCNLCPEVLNNVALKKYRHPTQIQKSIIPLIVFKKFDIMAHAQTGSGKTAAFLLPIINDLHILKRRSGVIQSNGYSPFAVIVSPTKELAEQLANDARAFSEGTSVRIAVSYGDMPIRDNIKQIRYGCDIFVATCGRLIHFVSDETIKLDAVRYFVLDEADKLLADSFFDTVKAIKQHKILNRGHRTFMFSATFDADVQRLAQEFLKQQYFFVRVGEINRAVDTVKQTFMLVERYAKKDVLVDLLTRESKERRRDDDSTYLEVPKTIIFVQHKRESDRLAIALAIAGFLVISINSDRTLKQRAEAMENFTRGVYNILVATDVAARGLNIPNVEHVINFDLPEKEDMNYIHRIGRTGRAGNLGRATSFFDPQGEERQRITFYIQALQQVNQEVPRFLLDIYQQQKSIEEQAYRLRETKTRNFWC